MAQTYDQRYVNLMIAMMPITLAARLNYRGTIPDLSYRPDARYTIDAILDSYPMYREIAATPVKPGAEVKLKPGRYYHPLHADIIDYLETEQKTTNSTIIAALFGIDQNEASDRLYELSVLGKLRKIRYRNNGSDNLYTLIDRQLTLADIPNGARNDRILALKAKGYDNTMIGKSYNVSSDVIRRVLKSWPAQRVILLAPPTTSI